MPACAKAAANSGRAIVSRSADEVASTLAFGTCPEAKKANHSFTTRSVDPAPRTTTPRAGKRCAKAPRLQAPVCVARRDAVEAGLQGARARQSADDGELVGRKIGDSIWAVYASRACIERHGRPERLEDLAQHALVGFDDTMARHRIAAWLHKVAPNATLVARSNSVLGLVYSAKAGVGVAPLPVALGDAEPDLVRVIEPVTELSRIRRILTTPELRRTPRVSAFFDFICSSGPSPFDRMQGSRPFGRVRSPGGFFAAGPSLPGLGDP
jgi:DNA-binding transcriptional LysR family regulator